MWIIICANYLIAFSSGQAALEDFNSHPETVQALACKSPVQANEADPTELTALSTKHAQYFSLEGAFKTELAESEVIAAKANAGLKDNSSSSEPAPDSTALTPQDYNHCRYGFVRTGPRTLKLVTEKCWKKVS